LKSARSPDWQSPPPLHVNRFVWVVRDYFLMYSDEMVYYNRRVLLRLFRPHVVFPRSVCMLSNIIEDETDHNNIVLYIIWTLQYSSYKFLESITSVKNVIESFEVASFTLKLYRHLDTLLFLWIVFKWFYTSVFWRNNILIENEVYFESFDSKQS